MYAITHRCKYHVPAFVKTNRHIKCPTFTFIAAEARLYTTVGACKNGIHMIKRYSILMSKTRLVPMKVSILPAGRCKW